MVARMEKATRSWSGWTWCDDQAPKGKEEKEKQKARVDQVKGITSLFGLYSRHQVGVSDLE
jgi:hypothetical protein